MSHIYDALRRAKAARQAAGTPPAGEPPASEPQAGEPPAGDSQGSQAAGQPPVGEPQGGQSEEARGAGSALPAAPPVASTIERAAAREPEAARTRADSAAPRVASSARPGTETSTRGRIRTRTAMVSPHATVSGKLIGDLKPEFLRELDSLRASLGLHMGNQKRRVLGFVGALSGEGATTIALHCAYLLARAEGSRVLLVDADLGHAHNALSEPLGERPGLGELLAGRAAPEDAILSTEIPEFHFLPAGDGVAAGEAAAHPEDLRPVIDRLGHLYDWVIADLPPVLENAKTPLLAAACDGVVFVIRAHRTPRTLSQRAIDLLHVHGCRILGTVLNARKESLPGFLRERV